jgi:pre-mRNA-processing factor 39
LRSTGANREHRPQSVSQITKAKQSKDSSGVPELDEATRLKAEKRFYAYYELHMDPNPNAQGPASFE